jgi:hypothetical protein
MYRRSIFASKRLFAFAIIFLGTLLPLEPVRAVNFAFDYSGDAPGTGFNDATLGSQRRAALEYGAGIWGDLIRSSFAGETITIRAVFAPKGGESLASAASNKYAANFGSSSPQYRLDTYYPQALASHLDGTDVLTSQHEIDITFNSDVGVSGPLATSFYYYGTDGMPPASTATETHYDFATIAVHEIGHGLGFESSFRENGSYGFDEDGTFDPDEEVSGFPVIYDWSLYLGETNGLPLLGLPQVARAGSLVSDALSWYGPGGIGGNGGMSPRINAPTTWDAGSSISHLDETTLGSELMSPNYSMADHVPSAMERGMLRDMGWSISLASSQVNWTGLGADSAALTDANWSPNLPFPGDRINFGPSPRTDITFDLSIGIADSFNFAGDAPAYTLHMAPDTKTRFTGVGVVNSSANPQTFIAEKGPESLGAEIGFRNAATAGNATYQLQGGVTSIAGGPPPAIPYSFKRSQAARVTFENTASAANATFDVEGGTGNGGPNALVLFRNTSTAGDADFYAKGGHRGVSLPIGTEVAGFGGQITFKDTSNAGTSSIRNDGTDYTGGAGALTTFANNSSASSATISNFGGAYSQGGGTEFTDAASAATATFNNFGGASIGGGGHTTFFGQSTAGAATIVNVAAPASQLGAGYTDFRDTSNAGHGPIGAQIVNRGTPSGSLFPGLTRFFNSARAGNANIRMESGITGGGGRTEFRDNSNADDATLII